MSTGHNSSRLSKRQASARLVDQLSSACLEGRTQARGVVKRRIFVTFATFVVNDRPYESGITLDCLPLLLHFIQRRIRKLLPACCEGTLHGIKTCRELLVGAAQRRFGFDTKFAREVRDGK